MPENSDNINENQSAYCVALAGNPNSGKTTLFNSLTGLRYKVANYPGVTVEKKQGKLCLPETANVVLVDTPGIYSIVGTSIDEKIATSVLLGEISSEPIPDCVVVVIDASNLERNLYLVTQLIDQNLPIVIALNMSDIAEKKGHIIHGEILSRQLDLPVISIIANKKKGLDSLKHEIAKLLKTNKSSSKNFTWLKQSKEFEEAAKLLGEKYINDINSAEEDRILIGAKLLTDDLLHLEPKLKEDVATQRKKLQTLGIDPYSFEATARYQWINTIVKNCSFKKNIDQNKLNERIDKLTTHQIWGSLIFVLVMGFIFQSIFLWAQIPMDLIDSLINWIGGKAAAHIPEGQIQSLLVDGVIAGVGNVIIFVPQIALLFFFLGLLEDTGYLARAAFLMDRVMRPFGLQGRSFIPLLSSFACAIPGILSARTIPSKTDRLATIMVAPLMSCSARLPVYTVLISAFVPNIFLYNFISLQGLTLLIMYLLGIIGAALMAWLLKLSVLKGKPALFVMELPIFRLPSLKNVLREVMDRVLSFLESAGTMILACSIILWFLASYPKPPEGYSGSKVEYSYAGQIGKTIEPVIEPLGFNWEIGIGLLASFAAREVFITSLATVYNLESNDDNTSLINTLKTKNENGSFTTLTAISLMVFYVFACQCMSTLAVCKRETGSNAWTLFMFFYMTALAYICSFATYQIGLKLLI